MFNRESQVSTFRVEIPAIERSESRFSSVKDYVAKLADPRCEPIEGWLRVAVLDKEQLLKDGGRYELADPIRGRRGGFLSASLTIDRLIGLERHFATALPWEDLVGAELDLKLRTAWRPGEPASTEIVDVASAWVSRVAHAARRLHSRSLTAIGQFDGQRYLAEPTAIETINIIRQHDEPLWPSISARIAELNALGIACEDVPTEMTGDLGDVGVTAHLERLARGHFSTPDVVLIVCSKEGHLPMREKPVTASLGSQLSCPLIVGFSRGRYGSLLHEIAFAAVEDPLAALDVACGLALNARQAPAVEDRLKVHVALENARRRSRCDRQAVDRRGSPAGASCSANDA